MTLPCNKGYAITLFALLLTALANIKGEFECWSPPAQPLRHSNEPFRMAAVTDVSNTFRITPIYTDTFEKLKNSSLMKEKVVNYAINYWSSALKPKSPLTGPFRATRGCVNNEYVLRKDPDGKVNEYCLKGCNTNPTCYTSTIPKEYLDKCRVMINGVPQITEDVGGAGLPNTDYALIVDATRTSACDEGVLAYATICQADFALDRPIFGYINFCENQIGLDYPDLLISQKTAIHEMAHALGFSPMMYAFMRNENGQPRTPRDNETGNPVLGQTSGGLYIASTNTIEYAIRTWKSVAGSYKINRTLIKTPKILEFAKNHFGCPNLDGIELENQGGAGTASAHFEKHIVLNEVMAGSIGFAVVVSGLTLSFFEDSGWYHVDMSKAETYLWAKNAGCNFMYESCYEYMKNRLANQQSPWPWCNDLSATDIKCLTYENAYGRCNLAKQSTKLSPQFQYFDALPGVSQDMLPYYGGLDRLTEYCPFVMPELLVRDGPSTYCGHSENEKYADKKTNRQLENYGPDAMCFNHDPSDPWKSYQCGYIYPSSPVSASCHRFKCVVGEGLIVILEKKEFRCPLNGGSIQVNTVGTVAYIRGKLICPKCSDVCKSCTSSNPTIVNTPDELPAKIPCPDGAVTYRQSKVLLLLVGLLSQCFV